MKRHDRLRYYYYLTVLHHDVTMSRYQGITIIITVSRYHSRDRIARIAWRVDETDEADGADEAHRPDPQS